MRRELADLAVRAEPDAAPQETRGLAAVIEDLRRQLEVPSRHGAAMAARLSRAEEAARTAQETCRRLTAQNRLLQGEIDAVERGLLAECDGAEKSVRRAENLAAVEHFVARLEVLAFADKAAAHYGQMRAELEWAGTVCGPHDMQIGGHARSEGLIAVTHNMREFARMPGVRCENWVAG
jgi:hypothetical protein